MRRAFLLLLAILTLPALAQPPRPPAPPEPAKYDIDIRYRIDAFRNERARQFKDFTAQLKALGFERDPNDDAKGEDNLEVENRTLTRMRGTIPAEAVRRASRLRPVLTVLIKPPPPPPLPIADQPVRVEFELAGDVGSQRQRALAFELVNVLSQIGFRQPAGYDNRRYTRLVGRLPANQLEAVLNDIRRLPAALQQLPKTLLSDLRTNAGGAESVRVSLEAWANHPEGRKLVLAALEAWAVQEPAARFIAGLNKLVVSDSTLIREVKEAEFQGKPIGEATKARLVDLIRRNEAVREHLLLHFQRHEAAKPLLTKLFEDVVKDKSGPELMDILLRRLEGQEGGVTLPQLFRERTVIRIVEARPDLPLPEPRLPPPLVPEELHKIGPSLRGLLKDAQAVNPRRLEVLLSSTPSERERDWVRPLVKSAPSLVLEGRSGPIVSVRMKPAEAEALVKLPGVAGIRLPSEGRSALLNLSDEDGDPAKVLKATGLEPLLRLGKPPRPVRVAVIDSDFRGWQGLVGKKLPALTQLLDITSERNDDLKGDPYPGQADQLGSGTLTAMAVALAAPWCELVLVRVDPAAPHQLALVHRRIHGEEFFFTDSFQQRRLDLLQGRQFLDRRRTALLKEREDVFKLFPDDRPAEDPISKAKQKLLEDYRKKQAQFDKDEQAFQDHEKVYLRYIANLRDLRTVRVAVCGLSWNDGHPADGGSGLTRLLEDTPNGRVLWVQAAGNGRGQAWSGLFRDTDDNGVMEFAEQKMPIPAGSWSHEIAFLAWQPFKGERARTLPGKARLRLTMQWREAHDPEYTKDLDDPFRTPLSSLRLIVLRQLDPAGAKQPADDMKTGAETSGPPLRLAAEPGSAVYEHVLEFDADAGSRFGLRVEGQASKSTRPPGSAELPRTDRFGEVRPRIFIETLDGGGRVVFESYATSAGDYGILADARSALTAGALSAANKPQHYSTEGTPHGLELLEKPDVRTFDRLGIEGAKSAGGSSMSAGFIGGYAASLLAHGTPTDALARELKRRLKPQ